MKEWDIPAATTAGSFNNHSKYKHEGVRYPCDQCEYSATTVSNIKKHIECKHEGMRHYSDQWALE